MPADRYVLLGLAPARAPWFAELARWATSGMLPVEFVKAVSLEEVRVRLRSGRGFSALLVGADVIGLDRDLIAAAHDAATPVVVIGTDRAGRDWTELGAASVLAADFDRGALVSVLEEVATPISRSDHAGNPAPVAAPEDALRGRLVAVTGPGGAGSSTLAMSIAQGLAGDPRYADVVCLADLALRADQGALHDVGDVVPSVVELTEAHRSGTLGAEQVRDLTWDVAERGYRLLLGLRRSREWTAVRPRSFAAALDGLRRAFRILVADVDPDLDGEAATGSIDLEERNVMARTAVLAADVVVAVGRPGVKGLHSLLRVLTDLLELGVPADHLVPVINEAPRTLRARAEVTRAFGVLAAEAAPGVGSPLFVAHRARVEEALRDGARLPRQLGANVTRSVSTLLERAEPVGPLVVDEPVPIAAGSLGSWTEDEL